MKSFQFPLDKALEWRRTELRMAEACVDQQVAALGAIDQERAELDALGHSTEAEVRQFKPLAGRDLGALSEFRVSIRVRGRELVAKRVQCQKELAARQAAMMEARRRCRLLEKVKERRHSEWQSAANRELDELAADSYLAQWARRHGSSL